jgi:hypothetical protein
MGKLPTLPAACWTSDWMWWGGAERFPRCKERGMRLSQMAGAALAAILAIGCADQYPTGLVQGPMFGATRPAETLWHAGSVGARAEFSMIDEAGVQTDVRINVSRSFNPAPGGRGAGPPESQTRMHVGIQQFDSACPPSVAGCPRPVPDARSPVGHTLDASSFHFPAISRGARVTVNTTIPVIDRSSSSSFDVLVDLTWVCTGEVERTVTHHSFGTPSEERDVKSLQQVRCAARATGVVSDGMTHFVGGPSESAGLHSDNLVEIEVRR